MYFVEKRRRIFDVLHHHVGRYEIEGARAERHVISEALHAMRQQGVLEQRAIHIDSDQGLRASYEALLLVERHSPVGQDLPSAAYFKPRPTDGNVPLENTAIPLLSVCKVNIQQPGDPPTA